MTAEEFDYIHLDPMRIDLSFVLVKPGHWIQIAVPAPGKSIMEKRAIVEISVDVNGKVRVKATKDFPQIEYWEDDDD